MIDIMTLRRSISQPDRRIDIDMDIISAWQNMYAIRIAYVSVTDTLIEICWKNIF